MTPKRRERMRVAPRPRGAALRGRWRRGVLLAALPVALLLGVRVGLRWRWRHGAARIATPAEELTRAALADSAREALRHNDWDRAQVLFGRLLRLDPRDPTLLLGSGLALHNGIWLQDPRQRRPPCRTSLERLGAERRALALMDSAAACAVGFERWARVRERVAQVYQNLGLFADALDVYRDIQSRNPQYVDARVRALAVIERLRSGAE